MTPKIGLYLEEDASKDQTPKNLNLYSKIDSQIELYRRRSVEQRRQIPGLSPARADIILGGAIILRRLLTRIDIDRATVSTRGLRWGVLYEMCGHTI